MLEMIKSLIGQKGNKGEKKAVSGCCGGHAQKMEEKKAAGEGCCGGSQHAHHIEEEQDQTAPSGGCCGGHHKH